MHNGSSLFTGDAGQGESNIRRWLIENDWLEAIVALPLNLFYNTGIATYVWVLGNRKPAHRKGKVQLIDASQWFKPLRKNLGKKNCELSPDDIERISRTFLDFEETPESKIFPNAAFGYWKVTVERPLRLHSQLSLKAIEALRFASGDEDIRAALLRGIRRRSVRQLRRRRRRAGANGSPTGAARTMTKLVTMKTKAKPAARRRACPRRSARSCSTRRPGSATAAWSRWRPSCAPRSATALFEDHNVFRDRVDAALKQAGIQLARRRAEADPESRELARRDRAAGRSPRCTSPARRAPTRCSACTTPWSPASRASSSTSPTPTCATPSRCRCSKRAASRPSSAARCCRTRPMRGSNNDATKIGYEVSFTRHFYKPQPLRTLAEISADILAVEKEAEGLLEGLLVEGAKS